MTDQLNRPTPIQTRSRPVSSPAPRPLRRRFRWGIPAAVVVGASVGIAGAITVSLAMRSDGSAPPPPSVTSEPPVVAPDPVVRTMPDAVDQTISRPAPAPPPVEQAQPQPETAPAPQRPAYLIIQDEIDRALAERDRD